MRAELTKRGFVPRLKAFSFAVVACGVFALAFAACANFSGDVSETEKELAATGPGVAVGGTGADAAGTDGGAGAANPGAGEALGGTLTASVALKGLPSSDIGADGQSDVSKSAFPDMADITGADYSFAATIVDDNDGTTYNATGIYDSSTGKYDFAFIGAYRLVTATYALTVTLSHIDASVSPAASTAIASAQAEVVVPAASTTFTARARLSPITTSGLNGHLTLPMDFTGSGITNVDLKLIDSTMTDKAAVYLEAASIAVSGSGATIQSVSTGLPAGRYDLLMTFRKGSQVVGARTETVNIFGGMTTKLWWTGSGAGGSTLTISESAAQNEYWIRGTGGAFYSQTFASGWTASNTNDGTFVAPLETLQEAVDRIKASGDSATEYTIYIDGTVSAGDSPEFTGDTDPYKSLAFISAARKIKISGYSGNDKDIIDCNSKCRGITVANASAVIEISNLTITNGGGVSNGGALYVGGGTGTAILSDGALINKNQCTENGGGIYSNGNLYICGSAVVGDYSASMSAAQSSDCGNSCGGNGGGISSSGNLYLGYSAYTDAATNTPQPLTGGVYRNYAKNGGGINSTGTLVIASGNISYNGVSNAGGAIYASSGSSVSISGGALAKNHAVFGGAVMNIGECFVYGSAIIGDSAATDAPTSEAAASNSASSFGGGIYNSNGKLYLGYSAYTDESDNTPEELTGGVYANWSSNHAAGIYTTGTSGIVKIASGNIKFNALPAGNRQGAGIFAKGAALQMTGGLIASNNGSMGAGVCVTSTNGSFTMDGGTISENVSENSSAGGGGVLVGDTALFTMNGGTIEKNTAARGGGVWNNDGVTSITGGTISQNTGVYGAGLCVFTSDFESAIKSVATMTGGTIDSNTGKDGAPSYGGGVFVERNSKFSMSGGTISNNSATYGGAVYISLASDLSSWGTFEIGGEAYIPAGVGAASGAGKNDVQITKPLIITSALTATPTPVATITPIIYDTALQVLDGTDALVSGNYKKFGVTPDGSDPWSITSTGYLSPPPAEAGGTITVYDPSGKLGLKTDLVDNKITSGGLSGKTVTVTAVDPAAADAPIDDSELSGWSIAVYYGLDEIETVPTNSYKFLNAFPKGTYRMVVSVTYKGTAYSDTITVQKTIDPVTPPTGFVVVEGGTYDGTANLTPTSYVFVENRTVTIGGLLACDHEVTQGEYGTYCKFGGAGGLVPKEAYGLGPNYPAYCVSWYDAVVYCNLRSKDEGLDPVYALGGQTDPTKWSGIVSGTVDDAGKYCGPSSQTNAWDGITMVGSDPANNVITTANGYRLPTEAEWEYMARNKNQDSYTYAGNSAIGKVAWYNINSGGKTHEVKTDKIAGTDSANGLGIYDMSGNVEEWCWDWHDTISATTGPAGPASSTARVSRGGYYDNGNCNVNYRSNYPNPPQGRNYSVGFRVVRNAD